MIYLDDYAINIADLHQIEREESSKLISVFLRINVLITSIFSLLSD